MLDESSVRLNLYPSKFNACVAGTPVVGASGSVSTLNAGLAFWCLRMEMVCK